jgi:hypothetical protein
MKLHQRANVMNAMNSYVSYKWDDKTNSGYRLRYDENYPLRGLNRRYVLEDWDNLTIVDDWGCNTAEEMVNLLTRMFDLDGERELAKIRGKFESAATI